MARRTSFISVMNQVARASARAQRQAEAAQRRRIREHQQQQRAATRAAAQQAKEAKQRYIEERYGEAEDRTEEMNHKINELSNILQYTLSIDDTIQFESLKIKEPFAAFNPDNDIKNPLAPPREEQFISLVKPPNFFQKLLPGSQKRHNKALQIAKAKFQSAVHDYSIKEAIRKERYENSLREYRVAKEAYDLKVRQRNAEVDEFEKSYKSCDPNAIVAYNTMVLERSVYPDEFPQEFKIAFVPSSKQLVVEYELPPPSIIPTVSEYRYNKSKDKIEEKQKKIQEVRELYQDVIASITLRTCHELFEADQQDTFQTIVFNGFVQTTDPSTGRDIRPVLISVRTTKKSFLELNLVKIDKKVCLRNLGAQVSPKSYEVQPVKPIVEFDMVDKRFVEQSDILADLESRPNLMELNPFEFENLVGNLFKQMGLDSKLTRSSKDGGVDVVAFDIRPIIGGKVVIQAKRYKNTVGVSAVRDLYGSMMNEGANKGILVTTSGYGPDAYNFSKDKPIELIDGGGLLYLLEQAGIKARIVFPEDWQDR